MKYRLTISERAKKDISSLDIALKKRIIKKIKYFMDENDPLLFSKKLTNSKDGDYRWRIGHFRVVFDVDDKTIKLLRIQHRKDVYKK